MSDTSTIVVRRGDRQHVRHRRREARHTFLAQDRTETLPAGFGALAGLVEHRLPPGARVTLQAQHAGEVVTYVFTGAMTHRDAMGRSGVLLAGEFQVRTDVEGDRHGEGNASRTSWAHTFQIRLRPPDPRCESGAEQRRFPTAERRGKLCVIASADGRSGSLRLHQDVLVHSAILDPGQHLAHVLTASRSIWLHVVAGELLLGGLVLGDGDGAGITAGRAVSVIAQAGTELLLIDLGAPRMRH